MDITPSSVLGCISDHPGQVALLIANSIFALSPAALTAPLFSAVGFAAQGPVAGSLAASLQALLGNVGARSLFAYLQSAAMGGYGVAVVAGYVQAVAAVIAMSGVAAGWLWGMLWRKL